MFLIAEEDLDLPFGEFIQKARRNGDGSRGNDDGMYLV